jgi:glycosyltransferase involved in cell wall biosynthesis
MSARTGRTILFVVNSAEFFLSHRRRLAEEASRRGARVAVVCGEETGEDGLLRYGIETHVIPLARAGSNPLAEWRSYRALVRIYAQTCPDLVHHVTIKPVIYGTRAARVCGVPAVVNAISGLGFVFTARGALPRVRRMAVNALYRVALVHPNMRIIFQNEDDEEEFLARLPIRREQAVLIRGSGVDLGEFVPRSEPAGPITFVLVARMLRDKGVCEFVDAAAQLRAERPDWRFRLVGDVDSGNPTSLTHAALERWQAAGSVEWLGHRDDVAAVLTNAHVVVLPSYREGLPKALIEAAASGRAAIASDVPGCRDVVQDGVTGLLVPPRQATALANAMRRLGEDRDLRLAMGRAARARAEARYGLDDVVRQTFRVYDELLARVPART